MFIARGYRELALISLCLSLLSSVCAQDRTTEQGEAQITDPNVECTNYNYPPVDSQVSAFPPIWTPATIVSGDTVAMAKWNSIAPGVPNIAPRGNISNISQAFPSYDPTDPACWWPYKQCVTPKLQGLPMDIASLPEGKTMGYGFDDGPNCSHNAFYDYLASQNQKATMYFIGSSVMIWPLEAQRALAEGHEICVHTWSHRYMTSFQSQDAFAELYYTMQAIKLATGVTPTCWRPPMGDVDDRIRYIANALGLITILWQHDSFDWQLNQPAGPNGSIITAQDVDNNYQSFINNASSGMFNQQGTIMLTHELNNFTMSEAVKFYPQLKQAFQYLVPVGVALNRTQPYVETNYSLPSFQQYISGTTTVSGGSPSSSSNGNSTTTTSPASSSSNSGSSSPSPTVTGNHSGNHSGNSGSSVQSCSGVVWMGALLGATVLFLS